MPRPASLFRTLSGLFRIYLPNYTPHDVEIAPGVQVLADKYTAMELVELTEPGPFLRGTLQLGHYIGLREEGRLIAMAGERMKPDGYTEISAVCTHPDFQGRGLGEALVRAHTFFIQRSGLTACLHVAVENTRAIALYERLGYRARRQLVVSQLERITR